MGQVACPPVSPGPLGLAGTVANTDTYAKEVEPLGINTHRQGGVLPDVGTAHAMAKGTSSIGSTDRADKATVVAPKALESRAYDGAGGVGAEGHHMARHPGIESAPLAKGRVSACWVRESATLQGAPISWGQQRVTCQDMEAIQPGEGHSPLETTEEVILGCGKKETLQGPPMSWDLQKEGPVRKGKGQRALTSGDHRGDTLQHRKEAALQGVPTTHGKNVAEQGVHTI